MPLNANLLLSEDEQDSTIVRSTFRLVIQHGIVLAMILSLVHGMIFLFNSDPAWQISASAIVLLLPLRALTHVRRSYAVFMGGLLALLVIMGVGLTALALRYGPYAGFHFSLLVVAPAIMVSGRIGFRVKWLLVAALGAQILWLDHAHVTGLRLESPPVALLEQLRVANLAALLLLLAHLMQRYFLVIVRTQRRLMEFASLDPLTGLFNRRHFIATANQEVAKSERYGGNVCVALADLDHFKSINDRLGHDAGDAVLRHVSQLIRNAARTADCVCRWGGEEFLVLLPQTDLDGAMNIAERICAEVAGTSLLIAEQPLRVTLTLGVAELKPGEVLESTVRRADEALYAGKAAGRNRAVPAMA